jgi:uncharacterized protein (DUF1015 family)
LTRAVRVTNLAPKNMAEIAPLTPLRYDASRLPKGLASVVAPPYDVIDAAQRAALAAQDPHNVVRLILPDGEGDTKYANAATLLDGWLADKVLVRDDAPGFYRYDQTFSPPGGAGPRITRRGFLGLVRLVPFADRIVLPHERTLSGPKEDRLKLFRATKTNLSPGFMLYRDPGKKLDAALNDAALLGELTTDDGVHHALAKVSSPAAVRAIIEGVAASSLLIADGHHRYETALRYSEEQTAAAGPKAHARGRHRYFMVFFANGDDPNLVVFPTHRHVHSLPAASFDELVARAGAVFTVDVMDGAASADALLAWLGEAPTRPSFVIASPDGRAARLSLKAGIDLGAHPTVGRLHPTLRKTDVGLLHAGVLEHILGITPEAQAAKTNLWYPQDARAALADLRGGKGQLLALMNATPVADVRTVAEAGEVMPQKSTFFYPKVLTGLAIHTLEVDVPVA